MALDPGEYRQKLIYQEVVKSRNTVGQLVETWTDVAVVWARVRPLSGREVFYARQVSSLATHEVTCRYRPGIKTTGRFVFSGRALNITGVLDSDSRRIELTIGCTEQAS